MRLHWAHWYRFNPSHRPAGGLTALPGGTSCLALLGGSRCLVRTPGGGGGRGGLATSCSHATSTKPCRGQSEQMGPAEPGEIEHLLSEQSSSAPPRRRLGPFCQGLPSPVSTSLLLPLARLPPLSPLALPFIFPARRLRAAPRVSVRLLAYVSPFKVGLPLPLKRLRVRLAPPSPALPRYGVAPRKAPEPRVSPPAEMRRSWDRGVRSPATNIWRALM